MVIRPKKVKNKTFFSEFFAFLKKAFQETSCPKQTGQVLAKPLAASVILTPDSWQKKSMKSYCFGCWKS